LLKALFTTGWLEGENPLYTAFTTACESEKIRVRFLVAATFSSTVKAITSALNTLAWPSFPLRAFTSLPFFYTDTA